MQRGVQTELLLDDGNEHVDRDGDPDLRLYCVHVGTGFLTILDQVNRAVVIPPITLSTEKARAAAPVELERAVRQGQ